MASIQKLVSPAVLIVFGFCMLGAGKPCRAQAAPASPETRLLESGPNASDALNADLADPAPSADPQAQPTAAPSPTASSQDSQWHLAVTPYLWFPGMHGTIGAAG